jgi:GxxExxY protein
MDADKRGLTRMKSESELVHADVSEAVIGCAMTILNRLGCGLPEKVYERALIIELRKLGYAIDQQKEFPIFYEGTRIGSLIPDLVVADSVIVDTKVVANFSEAEIGQMLGYLTVTRMELAILLSFRYPRLRWKRVVRQTSA